ncbi:hypothetical protein [Marinomonas sp. GJ51-6]|uniref:hypothetical protein n=1 Tax=Marinomonas sp. GJ51-6 TaxID=2992802 RepID=UPI0029346B8D|nr:hypothetical protein [Marinomonas sp. GJ51-6]WOD06193.1 hypothetical protein ONZ50_10640 [Marinomonas sp. GJ51-6]
MTDKVVTEVVWTDVYRHHFDVITEERIGGWAFKTDDTRHHPVIEIRSGSEVLWSVEADTYREDLELAGFGSGEYGFMLLPERAPVQTAISTVDIYIDGHLAQAGVPFEMKPVDVSTYQIYLDHASTEVVRGWVFKNGHESYRSKVEVRSGESVIASGLAESYRQDLFDADIGDGHYGFVITPNLANFPMSECECQLFVDGEVVGHIEVFVLSADQEAISEAVYRATFAEEIADFAQNVAGVKEELKQNSIAANRLEMQDDYAINGQLQVAMDSIAELSARIKIIEQVLVKHLAEK